MKQEDKDLLLKDLCARLPYGVYVNLPNHHLVSHKYAIYDINIRNEQTIGILDCAGRIQIYSAKVEDIKPYLRPMSSMTEEEKEEFDSLWNEGFGEALNAQLNGQNDLSVKTLEITASYKSIQWLLKKHFDFMGLIPKGLAIAVTEENNLYEN